MAIAVDPFAPLLGFYRTSGTTPPTATILSSEQMPQPYRRLLVNGGDMTPTLERFHGGRMDLRVLDVVHQADGYHRQVVLTDPAGKPAEFGAIRIHLDVLPEAARRQVLVGRRPLGGVLLDHAVEHRSQPGTFFSVVCDRHIAAALGLTGAPTLYGRCNTLIAADGRPIAEVVEILPPTTDRPDATPVLGNTP